MTPNRPHLLRAFYKWLLENQLTPLLLVDATVPNVLVPQQYVREGQIVLNISPQAVAALILSNDEVSFNARFGGMPYQIHVPLAAVLGLHARENGVGTFFPPESAYEIQPDSADTTTPDDTPPTRPDGRPSLRVVK